MASKNTTKTSQETMTLKYGYMWVETTAVKVTAAGEKLTTVTKKIARDPQVGFFRKIFRI